MAALAIIQHKWGGSVLVKSIPDENPPYRQLAAYLRARFGERVQKVTLDAGLTCPNRDGRVGWGGCIYCNARGSGTGAAGRGESLTTQLASGMANLRRRYGARKFIAYFQSFTNTYAPLSRLQALYEEALAFSRGGGSKPWHPA